MNQILGMGCIAFGCGGLWVIEMMYQRSKLEISSHLAESMMGIYSEIQSCQTSLPRVFHQLSQSYTGVVGGFYRSVSQQIEGGNTLEESWTKGVQTWFASDEMGDILLHLGRMLSSDAEIICKALLLAHSGFESIYKELKGELPNRQRSFGALCFSGGAMLMILLI